MPMGLDNHYVVCCSQVHVNMWDNGGVDFYPQNDLAKEKPYNQNPLVHLTCVF